MQLREAADALGVHYQTVYGWVRQGTLPARKTGRGYEVLDRDVQALADRRSAGTPPRSEVRIRDWLAPADRLYEAIVSGDETQARHDFERLAPGVPMIDLCERVITPALRRVGEGWAAGELSIATEHRASAICERLIGPHAYQPPGRPRGIAVTATPPSERHSLPALMAAACLREDRWLVHHLAADLPVSDVIGLALEVGADLVVLSSATGQTARAARRAAREIGFSAPRLRVLAGRPGDTLSQLLKLARQTLAKGEEPAVEADALLVARPQQPQHVDGLVGAAAAAGVVDADRRRLPRQAAHPDGQQPHPALGQQVDGGQAFGQHHGLVVGQQQDAGAEQDPFRRGGHEGQALERVDDRQVGRERPAVDVRARIQRDVLGQVEGLEAAGFGVPRDRGHRVRVDDAIGTGVVADAELHCVLLLA
jgi:MerR family transcriptional regulator, light-induced transcriptional regulator